MNSDKIINSYEMTFRFDQHEGNRVTWNIIPDEVIDQSNRYDLIELAEMGAPLSVMALLVFWKQCAGGGINASFDLANAIRHETLVKLDQRLQPEETVELGLEALGETVLH